MNAMDRELGKTESAVLAQGLRGAVAQTAQDAVGALFKLAQDLVGVSVRR